MMDQIIELKNITKEFHGVAALRHVNFALRAGEVHSLLGENGAGKSTLPKIIAGVYPATSGQVLLSGRAVSFAAPADALRNGIAMVFQESSLAPSLTVPPNPYFRKKK